MKWNDIRDRLKKSSNSVMESFKPESMMVNNNIGAGGVPVSSMKKTDFKKVIFPLVVAVVIVAGVIAIYFVLKNKKLVDEIKKIAIFKNFLENLSSKTNEYKVNILISFKLLFTFPLILCLLFHFRGFFI